MSFVVQHLSSRHLQDINFEIAAGECVGLSGESGSGKSVLLRALMDLDPHEGKVLFDEVPVSECTPQQWREMVGFLLAESVWWDGAVAEYFSEPRMDWFEHLGFSAEDLEKQVARCSTGERQRLAFLRMLHRQPKVLLLDEPTASLDEVNVQRMEALIDEYRQINNACVLLVSHDLGQIERLANRHLHLQEGALVEKHDG